MRATRMRDGVRARSPEARAHDGEEGWGEGFVAREPHTETITLSLDYGAALSPPGSLWSTRWLDTSTSSGGQAGDAGAHLGESSTEGLLAIIWHMNEMGECPKVVSRGCRRAGAPRDEQGQPWNELPCKEGTLTKRGVLFRSTLRERLRNVGAIRLRRRATRSRPCARQSRSVWRHLR